MTRGTCPDEEQEVVTRRQDGGHGVARLRILDQRVDGLALVGREGRDVDEAGDLRVVARLRDDRAAGGVPGEDRLAILLGEHELRRRDVVGERQRGVLHDAHVVAVLLHDPVDALPPGAVDEPAVDEHHAQTLAVASSHLNPLRGRSLRAMTMSVGVERGQWGGP
jgi:hypothetical protein